MKKVVIYVDSLSRGGAEHVSVILGKYLSNHNYECVIVTERILEKEYSLPFGIKRVSINNNSNRCKNVIKGIFKLRKILKSISPDIMLIMDTPGCIFGIPASRFLNIKVIVSERNDPNNFPGKKIVCNVSRYLMKKADGFVFQTEEAKRFYSKKLNNRGVIIENPLILEELPSIKENFNKNIVSVGRLCEQKNHKLLIDAFCNINKKYSEYSLTIYGDGPLRDELENYINILGMSDKIFLPGNVSNVLDRINGSFMFVMSSNYEGIPNALIEAMALGIPCISTDCPCGGPKSLISHKNNGLLFEVNNVNGLTNMLELYINDDKIRIENGKEAINIRKKLDSNLICKKWLNYFESL